MVAPEDATEAKAVKGQDRRVCGGAKATIQSLLLETEQFAFSDILRNACFLIGQVQRVESVNKHRLVLVPASIIQPLSLLQRVMQVFG